MHVYTTGSLHLMMHMLQAQQRELGSPAAATDQQQQGLVLQLAALVSVRVWELPVQLVEGVQGEEAGDASA